jgi:hypothetical protein
MLKSSSKRFDVTETCFMKTILTFSFCLLAAASLMAQGRVNFVNNSATPIRVGIASDGSGSVILGTASTATFGFGPASTRISLYASANSADLGPQSTSDLAASFNASYLPLASLSPVLIGTSANLQFVTNTTSTITAVQGTFNGGPHLPIPGNTGTPLYFRFTAITINGTLAGVSSIIQVTPTISPAFAATMFSPGADTATTWGGITMVIVTPEPSTLSLVLLGSLAIFRRRFLGLR